MSYWIDRGLRVSGVLRNKRPGEWTSAEIAQIRKLLREGGTTADVQRQFAPTLTRFGVQGRLRKLGISPLRSKQHRGLDTTWDEVSSDKLAENGSAVIARRRP